MYCTDSYSYKRYLLELCIPFLAPCSDAEYLSVLYSVGQLPTYTMQCWAASTMHYSAFCVAYIVSLLFGDYIYQNYIVLPYI